MDFSAVDESGDVGIVDKVLGEKEVLLQGRRLGGGTVDLVEGSESAGGPDDEAAKVTTRSQLEEVESVNRGCLNTGNVAEGSDELLAVALGVVDNERTTSLAVAATTELTLAGAQLLGLLNLDDIWASTNSLQQLGGGLGLDKSGGLEDLGVDNERDLRNGGDAVATGEEKSGNSGSGDSRGSRETPVRVRSRLF